MAISTDKSNLSVEFIYEVEEGSDAQIWVKYHKTDMGPTISLSIDGVEWFAFPATLFSEVTDFLRKEYGVFKPKHRVASTPHGDTTPFVSPTPGLNLPESVDNEEEVEPVVFADVNPVQSLQALAAGNVTHTSAIDPAIQAAVAQATTAQAAAAQDMAAQAAAAEAAAAAAAAEYVAPTASQPSVVEANGPEPKVASLSEKAKQDVIEPVARPVIRGQKEEDVNRLTVDQIRAMNEAAREGMANEDKKITRTG